MAQEKQAAPGAVAAAPPSRLDANVLLALVNTVAVLAMVGVVVYTKVLFKRPKIIESDARAQLEASLGKTTQSESAVPALIPLPPITVNIASIPGAPRPRPGTTSQMQGKMHYVHVAYSAEIIDEEREAHLVAIKDKLTDRMLSMLGRKQFHELNSTQGRYLLRTQIIGEANRLIRAQGPVVTFKKEKADKKAEEGHGGTEGGHGGGGEGGGGHGGGAEGAHGGGGEGGGGHGGAEGGPNAERIVLQPPQEDVVTGIFFTEFVVQ